MFFSYYQSLQIRRVWTEEIKYRLQHSCDDSKIRFSYLISKTFHAESVVFTDFALKSLW